MGLGKARGMMLAALALGAPACHAATKKPLKPKISVVSKASKSKTAKAKLTARGKTPGKAVETKADAAARAAATERTVRLNSEFVATSQLRPMAQQLASSRSAGGYAGVLAYAQGHPGVQAATAYLTLGHAYMLDHRFADAGDAYRQAGNAGELSDYADYLGAQALVQAGRQGDAYPLLDGFATRHPESIFDNSAPLLMANAYLQQKNGAAAVRALEPLQGTPVADHADYRYALARAYQASGDNARAAGLYRTIFTQQPLAFESNQSLTQLQAMGQMPSAAERKVHADAMFNAKHYNEAATEYASIRNDASLSQPDRDALKIYMAGCDLKLKHLSRKDAEDLPTTSDDSAALKLYLLAEISRTEKDRAQHQQIITQMVQQFPQSRWLEEALYSGGNMYLLTHDMPQAIYHYQLLVERFPNSIYAPSAHWRDAWMNYRLRHYPEAARLMDEQIVRYGAGVEASSALYWRGRIYEDEDKNFAQAANYYRSLTTNYANFYYGILAKQRLSVLGNQSAAAPAVALASVRKLSIPDLASVVPESDPHVIKARLLANAALNEYIGPELAAAQGSAQWGALAQAQIYSSFGETTRALQSMKKSGISFFSLPTVAGPQRLLADHVPAPLLVGHHDRRAEAGARPLLRRLAHPAGIGVQRRRRQPRARLRAHAAARPRRQAGREAGRHEGLQPGHAAQSLDQHRARHLQSAQGDGAFRRPARVRARRLQRRRRPRPPVDGCRRLQGHRRVRRVHPLHRNPRVRPGHHAQPRDVPRTLRHKVGIISEPTHHTPEW